MKKYKPTFNSFSGTYTEKIRLGRCKSDRITNKWTKTTKEAFGDNPQTRKGYLAEEMIFKYLSKVYKWVTWYEDDFDKQSVGVDFRFKAEGWRNFYTVDVKANLSKGKFFVYPDEISHKQNDRMIHVDVDKGIAIEYSRESMLSFLVNKPLKKDKKGKRYILLDAYNPEIRQKVSYFRSFKLDIPKKEKLSLEEHNLKNLELDLSDIIN